MARKTSPPDDGGREQPSFSRRSFLKSAGVSAAATTIVSAGERAEAAPAVLGPDAVTLHLKVNGAARAVTVEPRVTLLDALRNELDLTGAKPVCERGGCGACTVLVDGAPIVSCLMLAADAEGARDHHRRGHRHPREDEPAAGGLRREGRPPVRLLHAGLRGRGHGAAREEPPPEPRRDQGRSRGQPVPLRDLRAHLRGRPGRVPGDEEVKVPQQPKEPTSTVTASAGLPGSPQALEVHPPATDIKPWDLDSVAGFEQMGRPRARFEGPLKVTGKAKYTFDIKLPGMLYGRMVGASVPAAEIVSIDTSRAEALPGVKAVWTTDSRVVRFAGQDVAAVAAVSPDVARDAARLVKVEYRERPFTSELREAMKPDAPRVFNLDRLPVGRDMGRNGNVAGPRFHQANRGDIEKGFSEAEVVHEGSYYCPVHTHAPLETHGVVAAWEGDELTIYSSTQAIFAVREGVAEALGIDRKNVRVLCEHMGGGFGSKFGPSATGSAFSVVACRLAKQAGAPVKLMLDRHEEHLCTGNAPSALMKVKLGAKKDGTLTAVALPVVGLGRRRRRRRHLGAGGCAPRQEPQLQGRGVGRLHERRSRGARCARRGTRRGPSGSSRRWTSSPDKLGIDPVELRKKNEASPVRMAQYDLGAKAIGWERRNEKAGDMSTGAGAARRRPPRPGVGSGWPTATGTCSLRRTRAPRCGCTATARSR